MQILIVAAIVSLIIGIYDNPSTGYVEGVAILAACLIVSIVTALNATVKAHPHVTIGSYPIVDNPDHKTIITLEGRFYNGGYTRSSSRLLDQARVSSGDNNIDEGRSLYFTKQEMDEHTYSRD